MAAAGEAVILRVHAEGAHAGLEARPGEFDGVTSRGQIDARAPPCHLDVMTHEALAALAEAWWYYTVELAPGLVAKGVFPDTLPLLPRILMRRADLRGADCLDIGTMEGLMPVLMRRAGARRVLALDAVPHCAEKLDAVRAAYGIDFEWSQTGLMYDLARRLPDAGGFDLINLSGLLYHVFSPLHVLAGVRPLLKRGGLMIVSQNVIVRDDHTMEFNARGKLQPERNTFWYHSIPAFEEMVRLFSLKPVDCAYVPLAPVGGSPAGYISAVCRGVDEEEAAAGDPWLQGVQGMSWEYEGLVDRGRMTGQPQSGIGYAPATEVSVSLLETVRAGSHTIDLVSDPADGHTLRLTDTQ